MEFLDKRIHQQSEPEENDKRSVLRSWRGIDWIELERQIEDSALPVGAIVQYVIQKIDLPKKRLEQQILHVWEILVDEQIKKHAKPAFIRGGVLYINVDSSSWLTELHRYHKARLEQLLKDALGTKVIKKIELRLGD